MHVPLLIDGPGISGNRRITAPVSHFDLAPTFLEFAGIQTPPSMGGKSLLPVLAGDSTVAGRDTVLAACHERYDARAVSDGKYYYVHNINQIEGATLASPSNALNADQYQGGVPWFNRAYDATVAATGSPQRELLRILIEGELAPEELYDLDTDPWCTVNLIDQPELAPIRKQLAAKLSEWRIETEDYNASPSELTRREARFVSIDPSEPELGGLTRGDDFNGKSGALDSDPAWSLDIAGNGATDFTISGDQVDAPGGPVVLATHGSTALQTGSRFTASVRTGFAGSGVASGLALGIVPQNGSSSFWQFMLADGRSAPGGTGKDVRLYRVNEGVQQTPPLLSENGLSDYPTVGFSDGALFTLELSGEEGSSLVDLRIFDPAGTLYYENLGFDLGAPVPAGSRFGITTWASGNSRFDDFMVRMDAPLNEIHPFDSTGDLDDHPDWGTLRFGNGGADFSFVPDPLGGSGQALDAPPGVSTLASFEPISLPTNGAFTADLDLGFPASGIFGGLVFGLTDQDNWFAIELGDGNTANAIVEDRLFRIVRSVDGNSSTLLNPAASSLPLIQRGRVYRLRLSGQAGSSSVSFDIIDVLTDSSVHSGTFDLGSPIPNGSRFGVHSSSSTQTIFKSLSLSLH